MRACITFFATCFAASMNILSHAAEEDFGEALEFNLFNLEAPVGTLEFASMHEAGHVIAAKSVGFTVSGATVFQLSKPGVGLFWKGTTRIKGKGRGMAVTKLGGNFAGFFLDPYNRFQVPSFLDIVGSRSAISRTDSISDFDLGGESLTEAQYRAYKALTVNSAMLNRVYNLLRTKKSYP